jgi:hypothetical protein
MRELPFNTGVWHNRGHNRAPENCHRCRRPCSAIELTDKMYITHPQMEAVPSSMAANREPKQVRQPEATTVKKKKEKKKPTLAVHSACLPSPVNNWLASSWRFLFFVLFSLPFSLPKNERRPFG